MSDIGRYLSVIQMRTLTENSPRETAPSACLTQLKAAIAPIHKRVETNNPLLDPHLDIDTYKAWHARLYGFYLPLEQSLHAFATDLYDWPARRRIPRLYEDLQALGLSQAVIAAIDLCADLPALHCPEAALGAAYVIEGATLGGQVIYRHVVKTLALTPSTGLSFYAGCGADAATAWQQVRNHLTRRLARDEDISQAVSAAVATFAAWERWFESR